MSLPPFVLVTGNRNKLIEAERIVGRQLEHAEIDLPEIQSLDLLAVLAAKGEEAWRRLERPLIVEETGFGLDALHGFPGPLIKWMLDAVGAEGVARTGLALGDPGAVATCALLYRDAERTVVAQGHTRGRLLPTPRGDGGFGWDPVFAPEGDARSYAELGRDEKDAVGHRGRAWRGLLRQFDL